MARKLNQLSIAASIVRKDAPKDSSKEVTQDETIELFRECAAWAKKMADIFSEGSPVNFAGAHNHTFAEKLRAVRYQMTTRNDIKIVGSVSGKKKKVDATDQAESAPADQAESAPANV